MARKKNYPKGKAERKEERVENKTSPSTRSQSKTSERKTSSSSTEVENDSNPTEPSSTNDPEWYSRDPQLLLDAGSIPFSDVYGRELELVPKSGANFSSGKGITGADAASPVPGIATLWTLPSLGNAVDRNDPANVAATALYTHVRYVNSGRKNYDQADLMIYCVSIGELYSYINWMIRIYNAAFMFSQRNIYLGKALMEAMGVDPDDIIRNLANMRYWINVYINKISSFAAPSDLYYFARRAFMYANVYTESETGSIKDQMYIYNPAGFYKFTLDSKSVGMLKLVPTMDITVQHATLADLEALGNNLLADMWGDEDFGIMSGDILRAFEGRIITASPIGTEGGLIPIYDKAVLTQMKNSVIFDAEYGALFHDNQAYDDKLSKLVYSDGTAQRMCCDNVYQDEKGNLRSDVFLCISDNTLDHYRLRSVSAIANCLISIDDPVADPASVVEATRNLVCGRGESMNAFDGNPTLLRMYCGDTLLLRVETRNNFSPIGQILSNFQNFGGGTPSAWQFEYVRQTATLASFFKYLPMLRTLTFTATVGGETHVSDIQLMSPVENYTVQSPDVIIRLHMLSLLSLLYVPGVAKQINYMK